MIVPKTRAETAVIFVVTTSQSAAVDRKDTVDCSFREAQRRSNRWQA
jgi:hypothetical protein